MDLYLYRTTEGDIRCIDENAKVPVIFKGQVVKIGDDFLGESVFVGHGAYDRDGSQLHTIYGHIKVCGRIRPGMRVSEGDIIGTIANVRKSGGAIPPHLHVSVAWIRNTVRSQELSWRIVSDPAKVVLLDPLRFIECPYSILAGVQTLG